MGNVSVDGLPAAKAIMSGVTLFKISRMTDGFRVSILSEKWNSMNLFLSKVI